MMSTMTKQDALDQLKKATQERIALDEQMIDCRPIPWLSDAPTIDSKVIDDWEAAKEAENAALAVVERLG